MKPLVIFLLVACTSLAAATKRFNIDRLYSLPWIIGTQPKGFTWSGDSERLAFLWNGEGANFYDVWMTDIRSAKPVRVTRHAARNSSETDAGVSAVIWYPDNRSLLLTFRNQLYQVRDGQPPRAMYRRFECSNSLLKASNLHTLLKAISGSGRARSLSSRPPASQSKAFIGHPMARRWLLYWLTNIDVPLRGIPDLLTEETTLFKSIGPFPERNLRGGAWGFVSAAGGPVRWADIGPETLDLIFNVDWAPDNSTLLVDKSDLYIKDRRCLLVDPVSGKILRCCSARPIRRT